MTLAITEYNSSVTFFYLIITLLCILYLKATNIIIRRVRLRGFTHFECELINLNRRCVAA